jgi:hypothetical protein
MNNNNVNQMNNNNVNQRQNRNGNGNQMNNNNGNQRQNRNENRNRNNNATRRPPFFRPNVTNENGEQISLFIPRVDARTSFEKVSFIFHHYQFGKVKNVDFILKKDKNGFDYKSAYIHFDHFYNSENCCMLVDEIKAVGSESIYCDKYDTKKKWEVFLNTGKKRSGDKPKEGLNMSLLEVQVNAVAEDKPNNDFSSGIPFNLSPEDLKVFNENKEGFMAYLASMKKVTDAAYSTTVPQWILEQALNPPVVDDLEEGEVKDA